MSCYDVRIKFIETRARVQCDSKYPTNGFALSRRLVDHIGSPAWCEEVGHSLGDDDGALTLEVEDHGPYGDGCTLHVCSPWSPAPGDDDWAARMLLSLDLSESQVSLLAEALSTVLRLRRADKAGKDD
jgi:hypothetical protein